MGEKILICKTCVRSAKAALIAKKCFDETLDHGASQPMPGLPNAANACCVLTALSLEPTPESPACTVAFVILPVGR